MSDVFPLSVIVLNHEHWECVKSQMDAHFYDSPARFSQTRWIVVHNGRPIETPLWDEGCPHCQHVEVVQCENLGYGAGINHALRMVQSPFVLVLNSDLLPEPGFLTEVHRCIAEIESQENIGIVGFRLLNPDGTEQGSVGKFPTLRRILFGLLRRRDTRKYVEMPADRQQDVDWVTGACLLLNRAMLDKIGTFDEKFFMYYEDVDLCFRAWEAGWRVVYDPKAAVRHFFPYHTRSLTHRLVFLARHGMLTYFHKHRPRGEFYILLRIAVLECRLRKRSTGWLKVRDMIRRFEIAPDNATISADELP